MDFKSAMKKAAELLDCELERGDGVDFILDMDTHEDRSQYVYVWQDDDTRLDHLKDKKYIFIESNVGNYSDRIDAELLLEEAESFVFCRLYIDPDEENMICVQAALPASLATPELLAAVIQEVADEADRLEDDFFGTDDN